MLTSLRCRSDAGLDKNMNLEAIGNEQGILNVSEAELGWLAGIIDVEGNVLLFLGVRKVDHQRFGRADSYIELNASSCFKMLF